MNIRNRPTKHIPFLHLPFIVCKIFKTLQIKVQSGATRKSCGFCLSLVTIAILSNVEFLARLF